MIGIFDPEAIILGGGMSNTERLYKNLPNIIPKYTFADKVRTKILKKSNNQLCFYVLWSLLVFFSVSNGVSLCKTRDATNDISIQDVPHYNPH